MPPACREEDDISLVELEHLRLGRDLGKARKALSTAARRLAQLDTRAPEERVVAWVWVEAVEGAGREEREPFRAAHLRQERVCKVEVKRRARAVRRDRRAEQ